ncbi:MAG: 2-C-methyl-D-erythritol 4-phosphate cytidylyltransferase [Bacteroidales bacterium]|nr:2-C-methyl-D-erythritol 4-phosphate cytidylyltransferase [Bacteroidales bacterium]MCM1415977.1 2-C-methyl-D-erythritol 4-phosphate cytidylyltransferase [bacterium]MCM1422805.1 2-C-methyl-D-erythritol 4-phosphate cytidylyltransferase [bacterium]
MVTALVLSGGSGTRMGVETPKQYIEVNGKPIISYCLACLFHHESIDAVQIVADKMWQETILNGMDGLRNSGRSIEVSAQENRGIEKFRGFSAPGKTRQLSILNGLEDIRRYAAEEDLVLIHDAARPLLSAKQITDCLRTIEGHDGVLPVLPMKDTVYFSEDGETVASLLERSRIFAGQAPELFVLGKYYEANRALLPEKILRINGSTEPAVMAGMDVAMIPGDERNFKITTKADLERFREMIE